MAEIQKINSQRKKICAVLQEKTISVRSDGSWRLSSLRSRELLPDQRPPSSRHQALQWERDRGRALYRRHIVFDCLRCQWERGTAYCLPASASVAERRIIPSAAPPADKGLESDWHNRGWQDSMKNVLWTRGAKKEFTDGNKNQQDWEVTEDNGRNILLALQLTAQTRTDYSNDPYPHP